MTRRIRIPVFDERNLAFSRLRDARVLIYWPHGLGDFVHLGTILPTLEPSNTYTITRIGDDFVSMFDDALGVSTLQTGIRHIDDGSAYGSAHLGIDFKKIRNGPMDVILPDPLASLLDPAQFDAILYTDYPEPTGRFPFPRFSKARASIAALAAQRYDAIRWDEALPNCLSFSPSRSVNEAVAKDFELRFGPQARIMLLGTGGHTEPRKAWPIAYERDLIGRWLANDRRNAVVRFQDEALHLADEARVVSARTMSAGHDVPFAALLKSLLANAMLYVGVPAGPFHAAMNQRRLPVVGIWQSHHPDWFDEPYERSRHIVGRWVATMGFEYRPATTTKPASLRQHYRYVNSDLVPVDDVWREIDALLSGS
ncbi:MAG: glycosyltransferase family protein [Vulcanimicrobiaceae bacterium]